MLDLPTFNPSPAQTDAVLDALADPTRSLLDIAAANNTSIRALSAWLQSPEVRPHADLIDEALARRARSQAAAAFPAAIAAATKSIEAFNQLPTPNLADRDPIAADHDRAHCQAALRAASILLRIARFDASPLRRHAPRNDNHPPHRHRAESPTLADLAALLASGPSDADATCHDQPPQPTSEPQRVAVAVGRADPTTCTPTTSTPPAPISPSLPLFTPKGWSDVAGGGAQAARPERHPRKASSISWHPEGVLGAHARSPRTAADLAAAAGLASGP